MLGQGAGRHGGLGARGIRGRLPGTWNASPRDRGCHSGRLSTSRHRVHRGAWARSRRARRQLDRRPRLPAGRAGDPRARVAHHVVHGLRPARRGVHPGRLPAGVLGPPRRDDRQPLPGAAPRHHPGTVDAGHVRGGPDRRPRPLAAPAVAIVHRQAGPRPVLQRPARAGDPEELRQRRQGRLLRLGLPPGPGIPVCPATSRTSATPRCRAATVASTVIPKSWPSRSSSSPSTSTAASATRASGSGRRARATRADRKLYQPAAGVKTQRTRVSSRPGFFQRCGSRHGNVIASPGVRSYSAPFTHMRKAPSRTTTHSSWPGCE